MSEKTSRMLTIGIIVLLIIIAVLLAYMFKIMVIDTRGIEEVETEEVQIVEVDETSTTEQDSDIKEEVVNIKEELLMNTDNNEMVDIVKYSDIKVENYYYETPLWVKYGSGDTNMYITKAVGPYEMLIRAGTLKKLVEADKDLQDEGYRVVVWVAYRSSKLQERLREHYLHTTRSSGDEGQGLVALPGRSNHQRGSAVDMKIERLDGEKISMPTAYLDFTMNSSVAKHKDSEIVKVTQKAMTSNGFTIYDREWWHFNDTDKYEVYEN